MTKGTAKVESVVEKDAVKEEEVQTSASEGMEGFEGQELTLQSIPILTLAQSLTPEVTEGNTEGLKAGVLMNNTTKQPLGDAVELIVFKMWNGRTKFPPRGDNGPIECWSPDAITGRTYGKCKECAFSAFELKNDRCLEQNFFIVGLASNPNELYRLIFSKSNKRMGTILTNVLRAECSKAHRSPIYAVKILLSTKRVKNEKANAYYFVYEVKPNGLVEPERLADLRSIYLQMTDLRKAALDDFKVAIENGSAEESEVEEDVVDEKAEESIKTDFSEDDSLL